MKITVITLFPEMFDGVINNSILKRAQEKGLVEYKLLDHRQFGIGQHKIVDDKPYGGGVGMVLRVDVLHEAINAAKTGEKGEIVAILDAKGIPYTQEVAETLSKINHLILICGHYEGFDERVKKYVDMEISLGDYVLTGGEIPAMAIIDSITRLLPGVLKDETATVTESHSKNGDKRILEHPHYTRPQKYDGQEVPEILLSGDHKKIDEFKAEESINETKKRRPDLL